MPKMRYMGVVEDVRQVIQDFITPELRAIAERIEGLEKRFTAFETAVGVRLSNQDKLADARHSEVLANLETIKVSLQLNARLERLEAQRPSASQ